MATVVPPISNHLVSTEVVLPAYPMQHDVHLLSNLDLTIPSVCFYVYFCYKKPCDRTFQIVISHLKASLSRALAIYYVFAGRLVTNRDGSVEVLCNNKGAQFTQAYDATALAQLNLYNAEQTVQGKLVPPFLKDSDENALPVFAVQVTEFSCGGMVVGCRFDHRIADGSSANMFLTCWGKLSSNVSSVSDNPSFVSSILCPRDPPTCCAEIENMYVKKPYGISGQETALQHSESRIYYLHAREVINLQISANKDGNHYTKLEAFSAYLWKLLVNAQDLEDTKICRMAIVVDGRSRLRNFGISSNFFGNVILAPFADCNAGNLKSRTHSWSTDLIHNAIFNAANEEHFLSVTDLVEITKPASVLPKIYCKADGIGLSVVVSSALRFPLYEVDYGWGRPRFASYHFPWGSETGYVMPSQSPEGDGSWVVYMYLPLQQLNAIESQPNCILRPISQDFIG